MKQKHVTCVRLLIQEGFENEMVYMSLGRGWAYGSLSGGCAQKGVWWYRIHTCPISPVSLRGSEAIVFYWPVALSCQEIAPLLPNFTFSSSDATNSRNGLHVHQAYLSLSARVGGLECYFSYSLQTSRHWEVGAYLVSITSAPTSFTLLSIRAWDINLLRSPLCV